jgi:hypothetical protein
MAVEAYPSTPVSRGNADKVDDIVKVFASIGVDSHTIRLRILKRMARLDPKAASAMLEEFLVDAPAVIAGCGQLVIPSPSTKEYSTLLEVFPDRVDAVILQLITPQQAGSFVRALSMRPKTPPNVWSRVLDRLPGILECRACTTRVLATAELQSDLGAILQRRLSEGGLSSELQTKVAAAYVDSVQRLLMEERCADARTAEGRGDLILNKLVPTANVLAVRYKLSALHAENVAPRYSKATTGNLIPPGIEESARRLNILVSKVNEGGTTALKRRFAENLTVFSGARLSPVVPAADFFMRASGVYTWGDTVRDESCQQGAVNALSGLLRQVEIKKRFPAAWLMAVRYMLNLSKSPIASVSRHVRSWWETVSDDRELQIYLAYDKQLLIRSYYEPQAASRIGALMAPF